MVHLDVDDTLYPLSCGLSAECTKIITGTYIAPIRAPFLDHFHLLDSVYKVNF